MKLINSIVFSLLLGFSSLVSAKTIEMDVNGLVCAFCAQGIQKSLKAFPATEAVYVSLENRIVAVQLKDGSDIDDAALRKAIVDSGYAVVAIRRTDNSLDEIRKRAAHHE
ncbi:MAG TPA: heavy-metal-associated domain-containing protein [Pseudoxanthomonas sp.]|nr:heavy-metal-associated domain-containing protein [Pseudoxanthomonas sp.]